MDFPPKQNIKKFPDNTNQLPQGPIQVGRQGPVQNQAICAYHGDNIITNFCKNPECYMPLCPNCIPIHLEMHSNARTQPEIDVIDKIVAESLAKIDEVEAEFQINFGKLTELQERNAKSAIILKEKIEVAKKKVLEIIEHYFYTMKQESDQYCKEQSQILDKDLQISAKKIYERAELVKKFSRKLRSKNYIKYVILLLSSGFLQSHSNFFDEIERFTNSVADKQLDVINDESKLYTFNIELAKYSSIKNIELYKYGNIDVLGELNNFSSGNFNAYTGLNMKDYSSNTLSPLKSSNEYRKSYAVPPNNESNYISAYSPLANNPIVNPQLLSSSQTIPVIKAPVYDQVTNSFMGPNLAYNQVVGLGPPGSFVSGAYLSNRLSPAMVGLPERVTILPQQRVIQESPAASMDQHAGRTLTSSFSRLTPLQPTGSKIIMANPINQGLHVAGPPIRLSSNLGGGAGDAFSIGKKESFGNLERSNVINGGLEGYKLRPTSESYFSSIPGGNPVYDRVALGTLTNRVEKGDLDSHSWNLSSKNNPSQNVYPAQSPLVDPILLKREDTFGVEVQKNTFNVGKNGGLGSTPRRSKIFESSPYIQERVFNNDVRILETGYFN